MRHKQCTTDIALGQVAAQELEYPYFPLCQFAILGLDTPDLRRTLESGQLLGEDPRIGAVGEDGSRVG